MTLRDKETILAPYYCRKMIDKVFPTTSWFDQNKNNSLKGEFFCELVFFID